MNSKKNNNRQPENALNDCFERMLIGNESIEACLLRYPQHAKELKPLLETLEAARSAKNITPDPAFRARARYEFRRALYDSVSHKSQPAFVWRWRLATIASTVGVLLLTSTGGVMAASSSSMPGQPLYQVKRTIEEVQLTLTSSQSAKARLYASLADRRVGEIVYAATHIQDARVTEGLTQQFTSDLSMVSAIAAPARSLTFGGDGYKQNGAPSVSGSSPEQSPTTWNTNVATNNTANPVTNPPVTTAAPTSPTSNITPPVTVANLPPATVIFPTNLPPVSVTQVSPATTTTTQPQNSLSGINDPALLKLLQQYSVKNISELLSILDKVPPSTRAALLAAIQAATSGYGNILGS